MIAKYLSGQHLLPPSGGESSSAACSEDEEGVGFGNTFKTGRNIYKPVTDQKEVTKEAAGDVAAEGRTTTRFVNRRCWMCSVSLDMVWQNFSSDDFMLLKIFQIICYWLMTLH